MGEKPVKPKVTDLTQIDPDHVDGSHGQPWVPVERVRIESGLVVPLTGVLGAAAFLHFLLGIGASGAVVLGTLVVLALMQPQLAPKLLKLGNRITKKIQKK